VRCAGQAPINAYNIFAQRIGASHCRAMSKLDEPYAALGTTDKCWQQIRMYDYVDGKLLVERESKIQGRPHKRFISVYTWGPLGLIARRGVSVRNGYWNPAGTYVPSEERPGECWYGDPPPAWMGPCEPGNPNSPQPGGFVSDNPDVMQDYTYMADHMGNIMGLVDSATGTAKRQVFDAFGVNIGGFITFQCVSDHDYAEMPWHQHCGEWGCWPWVNDEKGRTQCAPPVVYWEEAGPPECPLPEAPEPEPRPWAWQAQPIERMQTGSFNWRGGEGSITDRVTQDMQDTETWGLRWSAYTRPSTGLIYMQNRYYEPETGRFTQPDPVPYGMEVSWGQNNRWVYSANDPVNLTDPTGEIIPLLVVIGVILIVAAIVFAVLSASMFSCYIAARDAGDTTLANDISDFMTLMGIFGTVSGLLGGLLTGFGTAGILTAAASLWGGGLEGGMAMFFPAVTVGTEGAIIGIAGGLIVDLIWGSILGF